jgi:Flp pilus assembly protein TadB
VNGPGAWAVLTAVLAGAATALTVRPAVRLPAPGTTQSGRRPRPSDAFLPVVAGMSAALVALVLVGGPLGLPASGLAAAGGWLAVRRMEPPRARRRRERIEAGLPHGVDLLAACLAAGHEPGRALDEVAGAPEGPLAEELAVVAFRLRLGVDPVTVWRSVAGHPQLGPLGRCVGRAVESGASVSEAMSRLAQDMRRDARARVEARARTVGVKAALPLGVCMLPAFVLVGVVPLVATSVTSLLAG